MIDRLHKHMITELEQNARVATVAIIISIFLNLLILGVNTGIALGSDKDATSMAIFFAFVGLLVIVNFVAEISLFKSKDTKTRLLNGLLKLYREQGAGEYYNASLLNDYDIRYNLFIFAAIFIGLVAIGVPIILIWQ